MNTIIQQEGTYVMTELGYTSPYLPDAYVTVAYFGQEGLDVPDEEWDAFFQLILNTNIHVSAEREKRK